MNKDFIIPAMEYLTVLIIKFNDTVLLHHHDGSVKLIMLVFLFIPAIAVNPADLISIPFTEDCKYFLTIDLGDIIHTGEIVKAIQV
jgi:hypothetical protein